MPGTVSRNERCPCGSGLKFKRCCQNALDNPGSIARQHSAVGSRIQDWASEQYGEQIAAAFEEIVDGADGIVLGDGDLQLIGTWALNERIAASRLAPLRVDGVAPGKWIDAYDLALGEQVLISSHDASRSVKPGHMIVGRLMAGPPATTRPASRCRRYPPDG